MKTVTFTDEFRFRTGAAEMRVFPKGWKGEVDDAAAAAARKAGALAGAQKRKPAAKPQKPKAESGDAA